MDNSLNRVEIRVLGCLIEKEFTTPDSYPVTLNALTNACNQKSNRHPISSYDQSEVKEGLDGLRRRQLAMSSHTPGSRSEKFRHFFIERFKLGEGEAALLCELMIRGPQTVGELRTRASRMYPFQSLSSVEVKLRHLSSGETPWVTCLPLQPGRKEPRYAHLLMGEPDIPEDVPRVYEGRSGSGVSERVTQLEARVTTLETELNEMKTLFQTFKSQFE